MQEMFSKMADFFKDEFTYLAGKFHVINAEYDTAITTVAHVTSVSWSLHESVN